MSCYGSILHASITRSQGAAFDRQFVRATLVGMLADDPRIEKWDEMCRRTPPSQ
jgi:hypothetical protein